MNNNTVELKAVVPDAIDEIAAGSNNGSQTRKTGIYTLTGQRVDKATHGLYIINGKKVMVK